jgi:hypothetical protein
MYEHNVCVRRYLSKGLPDGILTFCTTRYDLRHLRESILQDNLGLTIFDICGRNGKNDLVNHTSGLQSL